MAQADDSDTTARREHIKCMLAHLEKQQAAAPEDGPTDIMTELSTMG